MLSKRLAIETRSRPPIRPKIPWSAPVERSGLPAEASAQAGDGALASAASLTLPECGGLSKDKAGAALRLPPQSKKPQADWGCTGDCLIAHHVLGGVTAQPFTLWL